MSTSHLVVAVAMCAAASLGEHRWNGWRYWQEAKGTVKNPGEGNRFEKNIHHLRTCFISGIVRVVRSNTRKWILRTTGLYWRLLKWLHKSVNRAFFPQPSFNPTLHTDKILNYSHAMTPEHKSSVILYHFAPSWRLLFAVHVLNLPLLWTLLAQQYLLF